MKRVGVLSAFMLLVVSSAMSQTNVTTASAAPSLRFKVVVLNIAAWDTMLQPWFSNEPDVINTISRTSFDVLTLEGVWTPTAKDNILSNPLVKAKYKYSYYAPATQEVGSCPNFVPREFMEDYINCLTVTGVNTQTLEQPVPAIDLNCRVLGVNVEFTDSGCFECLENTMQELPSSPPPFAAIDRCYASQGVRYAHGGSPGRLILSRLPLQNVQVQMYDTFLVRRVTISATIAGVNFAFVHFAKNYLQDFNPSFGPFQSGPLQTDMASDLITEAPDIVVGEVNSGPDYQPDAHNLLVQDGYIPLFSKPTYCPAATHASLPECQAAGLGPLTIDNIYIKKNEGLCVPFKFAEKPVSDHIGVAALCGLLTH